MTKTIELTQLEDQVINYLLVELNDWIGGEGYSPLEAVDISKGTTIPINKLRGVLASLAKKGILESYETDVDRFTEITLWAFVNQADTSVEEIKTACQIA